MFDSSIQAANHSLVVVARLIARYVVMHSVGVQQRHFVPDQLNIAREGVETSRELANGRRRHGRRRIIARFARHGQIPQMATLVAVRIDAVITSSALPQLVHRPSHDFEAGAGGRLDDERATVVGSPKTRMPPFLAPRITRTPVWSVPSAAPLINTSAPLSNVAWMGAVAAVVTARGCI
jgi:hypothetical protein